MKSKFLIVIGILSILFLINVASGAFVDTFQNHPGNQLTEPSTDTGAEWEVNMDSGCSGQCSASIYGTEMGSLKIHESCKWDNSNYDPAYTWIEARTVAPPTTIEYISFRTLERYLNDPLDCIESKAIRLYFYDVSGNQIGYTSDLWSYFAPTHHLEFVKDGDVIKLYKDGVFQANVASGIDDDIYYFGIRCNANHKTHAACARPDYFDIRIDDVSTGSGNVIGAIPWDWYIRRDIASPSLSGLYDEGHNKQSDNTMHATYTWHNVQEEDPADTIKMRHVETQTLFDSTAIYTDDDGTLTYNFTELLFHDDYTEDLFGLYELQMYKQGEIIATDYFFYKYQTTGCTIGYVNFDKDTYITGALATITTSLDDEDFNEYNYVVNITDSAGNLQESFDIESTSQQNTWDTTGLDSGYYYAFLNAINKTSGFSYTLAYDRAYVTAMAEVSGTTYDAENTQYLPSVSVVYVQPDNTYNATSNDVGYYEIGQIPLNVNTTVAASKSNYTFNNFICQFVQPGVYTVNLYLLPDEDHITHSGNAVVGLAQVYPYRQAAAGITVNIWNGSWNSSTTSNSMGYYKFDNLSAGTYSMQAEGAGYTETEVSQVVVEEGGVTYKYFLLNPLYTLTIKAKDKDTGSLLSAFSAVIDNSDEYESAGGVITVENLGWGVHVVQVAASGYYSTADYVYMDSDKTETFELEPVAPGSGEGLYYPAHYVRFTVLSCKFFLLFCDGVQGVNVTVVSTGNESNSTSGVTGSDGSVAFELSKDVKYDISFQKGGWTYNMSIYPTAEDYTIYMTDSDVQQTESLSDSVEWQFTANEVGDDAYLNLTYNDASGHTENLTFTVYEVEADEKGLYNTSNRTLIYSSSVEGVSSYNFSYLAEDCKGHTYIVGLNATYTDNYFEPVEVYKVYAFKAEERLIDLGFKDEKWYMILSIALLFFVGALFSEVSVDTGAVVVAGFAWLLKYFGWLPTSNVVLMSAFIIAILFYMSRKARQEGID